MQLGYSWFRHLDCGHCSWLPDMIIGVCLSTATCHLQSCHRDSLPDLPGDFTTSRVFGVLLCSAAGWAFLMFDFNQCCAPAPVSTSRQAQQCSNSPSLLVHAELRCATHASLCSRAAKHATVVSQCRTGHVQHCAAAGSGVPLVCWRDSVGPCQSLQCSVSCMHGWHLILSAHGV
jgi:hypothetical protein